jgi:uncharacterized membrane protein YdcZ (DUF606 family)
MKRLGQSLFALAATTIGLLSLPTNASAFTIRYAPEFTDAQFESLISNGGYREEFVVQSQIGNNAVQGQNPWSGDTELQIFDAVYANNSAPYTRSLPGVASSNYGFTSGQAVDFLLQVTGSQVTYTVGNRVLTSSSFTAPFTDLFLRTRADNGSMLISDLTLNGQSINSLESNSSDTLKYIAIGGLTGDFTLSGKSTMTFTQAPFAQATRGARVAYQIKAGRLTDSARTTIFGQTPATSVPEPSAIAALLVTGGIIAASNKRKKVANP